MAEMKNKSRETLLEPAEFFQVGTQKGELRIYLRYELFRALDDFAVRDTSREQCGLLVGRLGQGSEGPFLVVEDAIESSVGDDRTGRFNAGTWQRARRIAKTRHPNRLVVGWFHTHPGTGLELSDEELQVHEKFFPEDWQIVYLVDPVRRDRNFHLRQGGELKSVDGFRIFGKEGAKPDMDSSEGTPSVRSVPADEQLKERYLERSLEKIQKMLRRPAVGFKDYLIVALLLTNLGVLLWRPSPPVKVDLSELAAGQSQLSEQLTNLRSRMEKLENHLAELQLLDEQLQLAVGEEEPLEALPTPAVEESPEVKPTPAEPPVKPNGEQPADGKKVKLHKVQGGDTLSTIASKYYDESGPNMVTALGRFNKLKGPNYAIFPGDTVKIPARENLKL